MITVGQRRGLGIAAGEPLYVIQTEPASNRVVVGSGAELLRSEFTVSEVNWISIAPPTEAVRGRVRIRNRHVPADATIRPIGEDRAAITFDEPQRAVTPGQAAVFYQDDVVLGGSWID